MRALDPDVRRVVRFDDDNLDLCLDVKVEDRWRRVVPVEARDALASKSFNAPSGPVAMGAGAIADFFANPRPNATGANATGASSSSAGSSSQQ